MLNNRPVQWLVSTSWQGQYSAVGQANFRFGYTLDIFQIQDHGTPDPAKAVIQFLLEIAQGALYGVVCFCMDSHIVLMDIQIANLLERNPHHLTIGFQVQAPLLLLPLFHRTV